MLIGDVFYYNLDTAKLLKAFDRGVTAVYASEASADEARELVEWRCTNGDPRDVRYFVGGHQITAASAVQAMAVARKRQSNGGAP